MTFNIEKINRNQAISIANWSYEQPYSIYSGDGSKELIEDIMKNPYYAVTDEEGKLMGFYCFGVSAQVPTGNQYNAYSDDSYIDIGLGLKPELCGKGKGYDFVLKLVQFAREEYNTDKIRLTVALFNKRAMRLYRKMGFIESMSFQRVTGDSVTEFLVMTLS